MGHSRLGLKGTLLGAVFLLGFAGPAAAAIVPVLPDGILYSLEGGNSFTHDYASFERNSGFENSYLFTTDRDVETSTVAVALSGSPAGNFTMKNLRLTWYEGETPLQSKVFSNPQGNQAGPFLDPLYFAMTADGLYRLVVSGLTSSEGGGYKLDLAVSAVPLPPAAVLFGSVLVVAGYIGRRRRKVRGDEAAVV